MLISNSEINLSTTTTILKCRLLTFIDDKVRHYLPLIFVNVYVSGGGMVTSE